MKRCYKQIVLINLLLVLSGGLASVLAQVGYNFTASSSTFTPISGGTNVASIQSDEAISGTIPIGFTFNFAGQPFTQLLASSNGFLTFDLGDWSDYSNDMSANDHTKLIAPLWDDLSGSVGSANYITTGTAPNRIFTMEWLNYKWIYYASAPGISFQVKLYETSDKIEFIYRQELGALEFPSASIGIITDSGGDFVSLANTSTSPTLDPKGFNNINTKPATNQVYAFSPYTAVAPTIQATNVAVFSGLTNVKMNIEWTNGNGQKRMVFMKQTNIPTDVFAPVDGTTYPVSPTFGIASVGSGWYCVYRGMDSRVSVLGLSAGLPYQIQVMEINGMFSSPAFLSSVSTGNPNIITTSSTLVSILTSSSGSFIPISGGTVVSPIQADEQISSALPIGFTFKFAGNSYTQLKASSNGYITFDLTAYDQSTNVINGTQKNIIAPLWDDLSGVGGTASYSTTGTSPNRIFTMEWLNWKWNWIASSAGISFQVKLYETSNRIEFIYRQESGTLSSPSASIGLIGNSSNDFISLADASATPALSVNGYNNISTKPANGQVYTFDLKDQSITFGPLTEKVYGDADFDLTGTASSGLTVSYTSSNPAVAEVSGQTVTIVGAGTTTITALQHGDYLRQSAPSVPQILMVNPKSVNVTGVTALNKVYDGTTTAVPSGGVLEGVIDGDIVTLGNGTGNFADKNVGTAKVVTFSGFTLTGEDGPDYILAAQPASATANITTAAISISGVTALKVYDGNTSATISGTPTLTGKAGGDDVLVVDNGTSANFSDKNVGQNKAVAFTGYSISGADAGNYILDLNQSTIGEITAAPLAVIGISASDKIYDGITSVTLTGTAALNGVISGDVVALSGTGAGQFADANAGNNKTVTVTGYTTSGTDAGNYSLSQPALTANITKANQTITFATVAAKTQGDAAFALSSSSSSTLTVAYTIVSGPATVSGSTVTLTGAGSVTVKASQAGDGNYNAASDVSQSFCVNPSKPAITVSLTNPEHPLLTSSASTGNQWYLDGTAIANSTGATVTISQAGNYTVKVTVDGCASAISDAKAMIVTGVESNDSSIGVVCYPNPAVNEITIHYNNSGEVQELKIIDLSGRVMQQGGRELVNVPVSVAQYGNGTYLVRIKTGNQVVTGKFVKN